MQTQPPRWVAKFAHALRGLGVALRGHNSFAFHLPAAAAALVAGWGLGVGRLEWALLTLSIAGVLTAELLNTAVEHLARAVTREEHPEVRNALDVAAAAVLVASAGAAAVGVVVLLPALGAW